ncbi:hypothetical protein KC332_g11858 [Hortaea werneckii]|nr:hypothetical protein KC358_g11850 [Hortaea werneckii]KAI6845315.1 hypothetical protein KC350_g4492 [Hortaea werneckii]KAI6914215.1 hypothetical protein KC348_g12284 [Hortaea werneckii]KAI6938199.1 hypothetical protein KC341_g5064 [Hortaea werneckii]KAI6967345.1 hypothetical protein KC329_g14519 [Hortaea werneckii]
MSSDIRREKASVKRKTPDSEGEGTPSPPRKPRLAPNRRSQHAAGRTLRRSPRIAGKNIADGAIQRRGSPLPQPKGPEEPEEPEEPAKPEEPGDPGEPEENEETQDRRGQQLEGQDILQEPGRTDPSSSVVGIERANSADDDTAGVSQRTHSPNQSPARQGSAEVDGEEGISPRDHTKSSTQESDLFLDILVANVESTQALRMFAAKVEASTKAIDDLHNARGRVNWEMAQINNLPTVETAENSRRLAKFRQDLRKLQDAIERRTTELSSVRLLMSHASREQTRRDERLYSFPDDMVIPTSSVLLELPPEFWTLFSECKKLRMNVEGLQQELSGVIAEREEAEQEMDTAAVEAFRNNSRSDENRIGSGDADRIPFHLQLHRSPRMLQLVRRREEIENRLRDARHEQLLSEVALNRSAKEAFVAAGYLQSLDRGAEAPKSGVERKEPSMPKHATTPANRSENQEDSTNSHSRFAAALQKSLEDLQRKRLGAARKQLVACQEAFGRVQDSELRTSRDAPITEKEAQSRDYFMERSRRTRALIEAEAQYESVLQRAQADGLSGVELKSAGFSSHGSDGYEDSVMKTHVERTDFLAIGHWVRGAVEAEAPGFRLDGSQSATDEDTFAIVVSDPEVYGLESLAFGESISTAGEGRWRLLIDQENAKWRPDGDGFQAH